VSNLISKDLLRNFRNYIALIGVFISKYDFKRAEAAYERLVDNYYKINEDASISKTAKEYAYELVSGIKSKIYVQKKILNSKQKIYFSNLKSFFLVFVILSVFGYFLFLSPATITGNVVFYPSDLTDVVNQTYYRGGHYIIPVLGPPSSFKVSGFVQGEGVARLYIAEGKNIFLVYDNQKIVESPFNNVCIESCSFQVFNSTNVSVIVEINNTVLKIINISYTASKPFNHPPEWQGSRTFIIKDSLEIDLNQYFYDLDNQKLVFAATTSPDLTISIFDNKAVIVANKGVSGEKNILLIATDFIDVTRIPVTIKIE